MAKTDEWLNQWGLSILSVPDELKLNCKWAVSTMTVLNKETGRKDKSPRNPHTGERLSVTDPTGWVTYDEALNSKYPAMGMLLTAEDPYVVIDLDKSANKEDNEFARKVLNSFDSYAEFSASGQGVHIILRGKTEAGRRKGNVEVYSQERYIICTGKKIKDTSINEGGQTLAKLRAALIPSDNPDTLPVLQNQDSKESDSQVLLRMFSAKNGETVKALYNTEPKAGDDWSKLDSQLAQHISFFTKNHEQAIRLFQGSKLWRGKGSQNKKTGYETDVKYEEDYLLRRTFGRAWFLTFQREEQQRANAQRADTMIRNSLAKRANPQEVEEQVKLELENTTEKIVISPISGEVVKVKEIKRRKGHLEHFPITFPEGLVGDIAQYFYDMADRPFKEAALAGAIAFISGLAGRHYNVNGSGLGLYTVLLGQTGVGKNVASYGIDSLFSHISKNTPAVMMFRGPSSIASGQGLIRTLAGDEEKETIPSKVLVLGEFGHMMKIITARDAGQADVKTRQVMLDLYSKNAWGSVVGESSYSDSSRNTRVIYSPNLAILGDTTPVSFFEAVNLNMIGEGFLPRFFLIEYEGGRPDSNPGRRIHPSEDLIAKCTALCLHVLDMRASDTHIDVTYTEKGKAILDNFNDFCDYEIRKEQMTKTDQAVAQIWNRAHLNALRLAAISAVGKQPFDPIIDEEDAAWAVNLVTRSVMSVDYRIKSGAFGRGHGVMLEKAREVIFEYYDKAIFDTKIKEAEARYGATAKDHSPWFVFREKSIIPYQYIHDLLVMDPAFEESSSGSSQEINTIITTMVKKGYLREIDSRELTGYQRKLVRADQILYAPGNSFESLGFEVNGFIPKPPEEGTNNGSA